MDYMQPKLMICAVCGEQFDASIRNRGKGPQRYCGKRCRQRADNARHYRRRKPAMTALELQRRCVVCGIGFATDIHHPLALTCSPQCNQAKISLVRREERAINKLVPKVCEECGSTYEPNIRSAHRQKYCSAPCLNRATQRKFYKKNRGNTNTRLGTKKWRDASKAVIARDGGRCRLCGASDRRLSAHHLFHRTEAEMHDHDETNLVTLCNSCHNSLHDIKLGRVNGEVVISGAVFQFLGITTVKVV